MAFIIPGVDTLQRDKDNNVPIAELERDVGVIGLYFSAHWCPPCRGFTPKLAEWYTNLTDGPLKGKLEIVFISSDRDQAAFEEYFESMPWLALPFELRDAKKALCEKYEVRGIPTLVLLDAKNGNLITKEGRGIVNEDPNGQRFPWK